MKLNPISWFTRSKPVESQNKDEGKGSISPGRVSQPDDGVGNSELITTLNGMTNLVTPTFRTELIPIIRDLYKINPDVSIALQDMFKLSNTGHTIDFPNNTPDESTKMREHLRNGHRLQLAQVHTLVYLMDKTTQSVDCISIKRIVMM